MALQEIDAGQGVGPMPLQFGGGIPHEEEHRLLGTGLEGHGPPLAGSEAPLANRKGNSPNGATLPNCKVSRASYGVYNSGVGLTGPAAPVSAYRLTGRSSPGGCSTTSLPLAWAADGANVHGRW